MLIAIRQTSDVAHRGQGLNLLVDLKEGSLRTRPTVVRTWLVIVVALMAAGCGDSGRTKPQSEVVVYAALDREFSETVIDEFAEETGIEVRPKYDVESTKTVGLATAIIQERQRPRCDVFWNNEILHTLRLAKLGLLEPYAPPQAADLPAGYRSDEGLWHGFAARARVLLVNTDILPDREAWPSSIRDLADPKWKEKGGIARPLFGTTATHAAVLYEAWGDEAAGEFFEQVKANAVVHSGNRQVSIAVGRGQLAFGLTDTDDAALEIDAGRPVAIVFPDQGDDEPGTLFIPNTLAIIRGGPNPDEARRLIDRVLTPEIEGRLAAGPSAQIPVFTNSKARSRVMPGGAPDATRSSGAPAASRESDETRHAVRWMEADFEGAAEKWETASAELKELFQGE